MLDRDAGPLRTQLLNLFAAGADAPLDDDAFDRLALRVFAYAFDHVAAYAAYCRARDRLPGRVGHWTEIPAVPTAAFKEVPLLATGAVAERVFRTSGTTRGPERRGVHAVADLALYRASLRATFQAYLLPDGARLRFLSLMPPAHELRDSSLAFMITDVTDAFGAPGSASFADADGLDYQGLEAAAAKAEDDGEPVLLLGTSAAFIHWLDRLAEDGRAFRLPAGSRLMDTGGFKGRGRRVEPAELRSAYARRLGLGPAHCVNEYGMTEMLSQLYDTSLRDGAGSGVGHGLGIEDGAGDADGPEGVMAGARRKAGPSWVRSVAVDPETLEPLPPGRPGLLRHLDLANLGSVPAIQTEDHGAVDGGGVTLLGRATGAPPRGCSIAMDLLLEGTP